MKKELKQMIIPSNYKIKSIVRGDIMEIERSDGMIVFLNKTDNKIINIIRLYCLDKRVIENIVGGYRGAQISDNYNKKYGDGMSEHTERYIKMIKEAISNNKIRKLSKDKR